MARSTRQSARCQGRIDPIDTARRDRVYLFTGREDRTVVPAIVAAARDFYRAIGIGDDQIMFVHDVPAGHGFVTEDAGLACDATASPYIVDCDYDMAGALLRHIYGSLEPRTEKPTGELITFDQGEFLKTAATAWPIQEQSTSRRVAGMPRGAGSTLPFTAAIRTRLPWGTHSSPRPAS